MYQNKTMKPQQWLFMRRPKTPSPTTLHPYKHSSHIAGRRHMLMCSQHHPVRVVGHYVSAQVHEGVAAVRPVAVVAGTLSGAPPCRRPAAAARQSQLPLTLLPPPLLLPAVLRPHCRLAVAGQQQLQAPPAGGRATAGRWCCRTAVLRQSQALRRPRRHGCWAAAVDAAPSLPPLQQRLRLVLWLPPPLLCGRPAASAVTASGPQRGC